MKSTKHIAIQGYQGSFHHEAAQQFFPLGKLSYSMCDSFDQLAAELQGHKVDYAVMAIENNIAGTILQNYRILREYDVYIIGELYLRISHCLYGNNHLPLSDITDVSSHPMALNQCLDFLRSIGNPRLQESKDTALSAFELRDHPTPHKACICSKSAGELAGLTLLAEGIETNKVNYTRFFILSNQPQVNEQADKASIHFGIPDQRGQLLKVLQEIDHLNLNMSKLQSYPQIGSLRSYVFHLDVEFDQIEQYYQLMDNIRPLVNDLQELGTYQKMDTFSLLNPRTK